MNKLLKNKKGFTLVELIVVIVILGILAAILVPSLLKWIDKARQTQVQADAYNVYTTVQQMVATEYAKATPDFDNNIDADAISTEAGINVGSSNADTDPKAYLDIEIARTKTDTGITVSVTKFRYFDIGTKTLYNYNLESGAWEVFLDGDDSGEWEELTETTVSVDLNSVQES